MRTACPYCETPYEGEETRDDCCSGAELASAVATMRRIVDMDPFDGHVQRDVAARWLAAHGHTR
jgi:hypothetical protein